MCKIMPAGYINFKCQSEEISREYFLRVTLAGRLAEPLPQADFYVSVINPTR